MAADDATNNPPSKGGTSDEDSTTQLKKQVWFLTGTTVLFFSTNFIWLYVFLMPVTPRQFAQTALHLLLLLVILAGIFTGQTVGELGKKLFAILSMWM